MTQPPIAGETAPKTGPNRDFRPGYFAFLVVVFIAFNAFSWKVVMSHGYWGFLDVPAAGNWNLQVFLDLVIALTLLSRHMVATGKQMGVNPYPYILSLPFLGSIGPLAFYMWTEWKRRK